MLPVVVTVGGNVTLEVLPPPWNRIDGPMDNLSLPSIGIINGGVQEFGSVSLPEQYCSQHGPNLGVTPVLCENVSWIPLTWDVVERNDSCCNCFSHKVVSQGMMSLLEWGVRLGRTGDH